MGGSKPALELSLEELETRAEDLLRAGRHKDAVAALKALLQRERRPEWVDRLADAYAGRARELAGKGMLKEAAVIWRNRAEVCELFIAEPVYLEALFQIEQFEAARQLIQQHLHQIEERGHLPRLRMLCAVQLLAGREGLLELFAEDDPLRRDFPLAQAALEAYCQDQDAEMERQLKVIPFRSPFRDFRQILTALSLLERDPCAAEALLERIDAESPFSPLLGAIRASRLPEPEFMRRYPGTGKADQRFTATLKGWSAARLKLAHELHQLGQRPDEAKLLRFILRNREILGDEYAREVAMRILVVYPRGRAAYERTLGRLSDFHRARITALGAEQGRFPHDGYNAWYDVYQELEQPEPRADSEDALIRALILRHMARDWLMTEPPNPPSISALETALRYDPHDQYSYLELIRLYRDGHRLREARSLLDDALSRYPDDTGVLIEAVETAIAGNAFKKAARYARRTLELDPINTKVRDVLLNSHMAHARKQIQQERLRLARKELDEAANWARTEDAQGRVDLLKGILELSDRDPESARKYFASGFARTGGGLVGRFHLLVEAERMERPMDSVLELAHLADLPGVADRDQVLALLHALGGSEDEEAFIAAIEFMAAPLKSAARLDFSRQEMERLCETWLRLKQYEQVTGYARAALQRWPDAPVFVFHQLNADVHGSMDQDGIERLETALKRANQEGDMRTAHRIFELLNEIPIRLDQEDGPFAPFDFDFSGGEADLPSEADLENMIDLMMDTKGPPEIEALKRKLSSEKLRNLWREILLGNFQPGGLSDVFSDFLPPPPRKPSGRKKKMTAPDQLDLF